MLLRVKINDLFCVIFQTSNFLEDMIKCSDNKIVHSFSAKSPYTTHYSVTGLSSDFSKLSSGLVTGGSGPV